MNVNSEISPQIQTLSPRCSFLGWWCDEIFLHTTGGPSSLLSFFPDQLLSVGFKFWWFFRQILYLRSLVVCSCSWWRLWVVGSSLLSPALVCLSRSLTSFCSSFRLLSFLSPASVIKPPSAGSCPAVARLMVAD